MESFEGRRISADLLRQLVVKCTEKRWNEKSCPVIVGSINTRLLKITGFEDPVYAPGEKEKIVSDHFDLQKKSSEYITEEFLQGTLIIFGYR